MFKNVLRFYLRCLLVGVGLVFCSVHVSAQTCNNPVGEQCLTSLNQSGLNNIANLQAQCGSFSGVFISYGSCSASGWEGRYYNCCLDGVSCPAGQVWDQDLQQCINDQPQECTYAGAIPHESGEGCYCPGDQIEGLKNIGGVLQPSCIEPFPPEDPDDPDDLTCPAGQHPIQFGDDFFCWKEPEPNACPDGSLPYTQDGVDQCWTPDENNNECPPGTYKVMFGGQTSCMNPQPNIDDPDNPNNPDPNNPDPNNPGPGNVTVNVDIDVSGITSRIDQTNAKLDQVNQNLDEGNESLKNIDDTLGELKDVLDGPAQPMPGHSQASVSTFGEANAAFVSRLSGSNLVAGMSSMSNLFSVAGATCPSLEFDLPQPINVSVDSDYHCQMWDQHVAPIWSILMYVMYMWVAFRVFGSA